MDLHILQSDVGSNINLEHPIDLLFGQCLPCSSLLGYDLIGLVNDCLVVHYQGNPTLILILWSL
jgi:hypothetical protein